MGWAGLEFDTRYLRQAGLDPRVVRAFLSLTSIPELNSYAKEQESESRSQEPEERKELASALSILNSDS